jgi:tripartite-type tricarboxylate transporter receptor subunit TctC
MTMTATTRRGMIGRRTVALGSLAAIGAGIGRAQAGRPLRLVVPYAPGAGPDVFARRFALGMAERLGQPVMVDNRPGATTMLGTEYVAGAAPDGLTLLLATSTTFSANPHLFRQLSYSIEQFQPITLLVRTRLALYASTGFGARDMAAVVAGARAAPEPLQYGITARGNATHLTGEALQQAAGIQLQDVPYRTTALMQQGLLRGDIPLAIDGVPAYLSLIEKGRLNVIAVTGPARVAALPGTATFAEAGIAELGRQPWYGLLAPAGLDPEVLADLHAAAVGTMRDPGLRDALAREGATVETQSPAAFTALIAEETEAWGAVVRRIGLTLD